MAAANGKADAAGLLLDPGRGATNERPPPRRPSDAHFAARRERLGECVLVAVEGELDLATAPRLAGELDQATATEVSVVVADLTGVTLLDSTTLLVLLRASLELRAQGGELVVRPPDGPARRLFDIVGLDRPLILLAGTDYQEATNGSRRAPDEGRLGSLVSSLLDDNAHLQRALTSRIVIEQAKGILSERLQLDVDAAFDLLRKTARHRRRRVHDLANAVVERSEETEALFTA